MVSIQHSAAEYGTVRVRVHHNRWERGVHFRILLSYGRTVIVPRCQKIDRYVFQFPPRVGTHLGIYTHQLVCFAEISHERTRVTVASAVVQYVLCNNLAADCLSCCHTLGFDAHQPLDVLTVRFEQGDESRVEASRIPFDHLLNLLPREPFEPRGLPMVGGLRVEAEFRPHGAEEVVIGEAAALEYVSWVHGNPAAEARFFLQFSLGGFG